MAWKTYTAEQIIGMLREADVRLAGKPLASTRSDIHVDFPLRGYVTCGSCSHPMTSNWTKGRHGHYPHTCLPPSRL